MAQIKLENVGKTYDGIHYSVKDFNLTIEEGEFIIFVGPSGCGKSTTLRMIAGLEELTEGSVYLDGQLVNDIKPKDRDLAMVFQSYALYPHKTVYQNLAYPLKIRKLSKNEIDLKVKQTARLIEIDDLLDRKPKNLSGGQRQRVALGRCIIRSPKAFLMDEPLSNLDAKLRVSMRQEIVELQQQLNGTFIYVTHDQVEAMTMGDRIVVMNAGEIQQVGTPEELYVQPINKFVAAFIGSPSMNFMNFKSEELVHLNESHLDVSNDNGVTVGIRPEKISLQATENTFHFQALVHSVETLGAENYLNIDVNGEIFTVRDFLLKPIQSGEKRDFYIKREDFRFFDRDSELRIDLFK